MYQPPQGNYPPPPGGFPPPMPPQGPPKKSPLGPILFGCGGLLLVVLIAAGAGLWYVGSKAASAIHTAADSASAVQGVVQGAEKAAEDAEKTAGSPAPGQTMDPDKAAAAGIAALKSLVGGGKSPSPTLSRADLETYLPASVAGFARSNAQGTSGSFAGISGTSASAEYGGNGSGKVNIEVTDAVNMTGLTGMMDLLMNISQSESDSGFEKTVDLGDVKVHEKWENEGKHAELIGIAGGRFAIEVDSFNLDIGDAEKAFQSVDAAKLASVAASGK
jgi:hypothetical protein